MKKIASILLLLVLLLGLVACAEESDVPTNMQNVAAENAKFNLYVPLSWTSYADSGVSGGVAPTEDKANVTVTATLAETMNLTPAQYWESKCLPEYKAEHSPLAEFHMVDAECGDTTLGGKDAKRYVFTYRMDGQFYKVMQIITVADDVVYTMTFTTKDTAFGNYNETVEQIRSAFSFR